MRQGFDNAKYIELQAAHIKERISQFGGKLYLEFGGKLFDDYHASRVLPGFEPDSKFRMLKSIADDVEVIIAINANHIEKNKARGDLGITYDEDVLRLVDLFRGNGFAVAAVVITQYAGQPAADVFRNRLNALGIPAKLHYPIEGYPHDVDLIVSDDGYGKNEFVETTRPLVVLPPPAPARASSPPACRSSITSTSTAPPPATLSSRPSRSGIFPSRTRSTLLTRPPRQTLTMPTLSTPSTWRPTTRQRSTTTATSRPSRSCAP